MAASCPISRAGTRSRKPTGSLGLMAGTGRRSNPNASLPARTAGPSWRSISPGQGHRSCGRRDHHSGRPWHRRRSRHVTGRGARHRPQGRGNRCHQTGAGDLRQTVRSRALSGRQDSNIPEAPTLTDLSLGRSPCRPMPVSVSIRTTRPLFHGPPATMAAGKIWSLRDRAQGRRELEVPAAAGTSIIVPASPGLVPGQIDKSLLTIAEPKRLRDKAHLRFVASQPCLVCGRQPSDPHHLRFAQPRALGLKVSDEFTVPLCRGHHRQLHQAGNEVAWWEGLKINALELPRGFGSRRTQNLRLQIPINPMKMPPRPRQKTNGDAKTDWARSANRPDGYV